MLPSSLITPAKYYLLSVPSEHLTETRTRDEALLPPEVRADVARIRAVRLLMSVSVPRVGAALRLEKIAYRALGARDGPGPRPVSHRYTACITRLAFALNVCALSYSTVPNLILSSQEPQLSVLRDRILSCDVNVPVEVGARLPSALSDKELHNVCIADLDKLYSIVSGDQLII